MNKMIVFENKKIRHIWHEGDWWFSVVDVVGVLTENNFQGARKYWNKLIQRLRDEGNEVVTNCHRLKLKAPDGKLRETDCANKQGIFRIIQSIPSKRAEPFKLWLAKVGSERIDEIENPELAQDRMKKLYEEKGYPKSWIEKRIRGMAIRQDLTDEWKNRGIEKNKDFAILTNEIAKATFGIFIKDHKDLKGMDSKFKNQNLRDHMTDLELIFGMLGERVATEITQSRNSDGFEECRDSAREGGEVAGNARRDAENRIGKNVVSKDNYLDLRRKIGKLENKNKENVKDEK
ncbi:Bro-N domain-containing protein [Candidatus Pacearchaeota archaeon]|nr:Bro-N domain-containing protein [Candidatus Pacearchaeota archaeon]